MIVVGPDEIVAESPGGVRVLYVALTRPTQRLVTLDVGGICRSLARISAVARDRFWVKNCRPGAPPASSRSHSSVATSRPTARTARRVVGDRVQPGHHGCGQVGAREGGEPLDLGEVGHRHDARDDRQLAADLPHPLDEPEVGVGVEEQLGDRELRAGLLPSRRGCRASRSKSWCSGWASGNAATPTQKSPLRLDQPHQLGCVVEPFGVPLPGRGRARRRGRRGRRGCGSRPPLRRRRWPR